MAFWSGSRHSKLKIHLLPIVYKRFYTVNHCRIFANEHIRPHRVNRVSSERDFAGHGGILDLPNVRFYAKPALSFQKKEDDDPSGPRLNEQITAPVIRLVTDEGHCVISRYEAMTRARNFKLDLVEVDRHAKPPVCKIFDFHKEKYVQKTKEKEKERGKTKATIKKGSCKEVRFAAKIEQNDLQMKADTVKRLMESGYRVKCTAIDPTDGCDLPTLLSRFSALIKDVAVEESDPKVEKKQAFVVVRHIKFGPPKKSPGKNKNPREASVSSPSEGPPIGLDDVPEQDAGTKKSAWSVFEDDDDTDKIFDIDEGSGLQRKGPIHEQPAHLNVSSTSTTGINLTGNRYARDSTQPPSPKGVNQMGNRYARDSTAGKVNTEPQTRPNLPLQGFKQDYSRPNARNTQNKSYGIFSLPKVDNEQNGPAEDNRYKRNAPPANNPRMNRGPSGSNNYPCR